MAGYCSDSESIFGLSTSQWAHDAGTMALNLLARRLCQHGRPIAALFIRPRNSSDGPTDPEPLFWAVQTLCSCHSRKTPQATIVKFSIGSNWCQTCHAGAICHFSKICCLSSAPKNLFPLLPSSFLLPLTLSKHNLNCFYCTQNHYEPAPTFLTAFILTLHIPYTHFSDRNLQYST